MVEKMYGPAVFYEDAVNSLVPEEYSKAAEESKLDIVSRPEINVEQIEKGKAFIFTATVAVNPEVTLGEYKGLEVAKADTTVTDEEVEAELKKEQEKNARTINVEDRPAADGDTVTLDFEGSVDGVPFDGGAGKDYPLTLGSHSFIPGFEEQLDGAALEEEKEVNVTFPEDYQAEELAGKAAVFKCTIHKIEAKELQALDDDFAKDVSEFDTLDEYKKEIKDNLTKKKEEQAKTEKENAVVDKAVENATMEIPEAMIDTQVENMVDDFARRIQSQGLSMEQYMQFSGMTIDGLKEQVRPEAETRIKSSLVLEQIAKDENIEVSEDEINAEIEKMAAQYGMEADKLKEYLGEAEKESIKRDLSVTKAVDLIMENVKERAKAKTKKEKEAEAEEGTEE